MGLREWLRGEVGSRGPSGPAEQPQLSPLRGQDGLPRRLQAGMLAAETPGRGRPSTLPSRPPTQGPEEAPQTPVALEQVRDCCGVPGQVTQQPPQFPLLEAPGDPLGTERLCVRGASAGVCVWVLVCMRV